MHEHTMRFLFKFIAGEKPKMGVRRMESKMERREDWREKELFSPLLSPCSYPFPINTCHGGYPIREAQ